MSASLDGTANHMILVVGATIGFLVTMSAAIISKIDVKFVNFDVISLMTLTGIAVNILAVVVFLLVRRVRDYYILMGSPRFFTSKGRVNKEELFRLSQFDEESLDLQIIEELANAISQNMNLNRKKNIRITIGEILFVSGVALLLISLAIQFDAMLESIVIGR